MVHRPQKTKGTAERMGTDAIQVWFRCRIGDRDRVRTGSVQQSKLPTLLSSTTTSDTDADDTGTARTTGGYWTAWSGWE